MVFDQIRDPEIRITLRPDSLLLCGKLGEALLPFHSVHGTRLLIRYYGELCSLVCTWSSWSHRKPLDTNPGLGSKRLNRSQIFWPAGDPAWPSPIYVGAKTDGKFHQLASFECPRSFGTCWINTRCTHLSNTTPLPVHLLLYNTL